MRATQKVTSAMMMISSARLRKSQIIIENLYPYEQNLFRILRLLQDQELEEKKLKSRKKDKDKDKEFSSPFLQARDVKKVTIVAFASDTGLAGRFNDNISDKLEKVVEQYMPLGKENIALYPIGEKVVKTVRNMGFEPKGNYSTTGGVPTYDKSQRFAEELMEMYRNGETDRIEFIYHHFHSRGSQVVTHEAFLPIEPEATDKDTTDDEHDYKFKTEYIIEPDRETILTDLIPKMLKTKLFAVHLDALTSEHAARMTAMMIATDNADDLTEELTLEYNKLRQQSITNELLDLAGGSFNYG